ncbi:GPR1/FUN34/yaaH family-domain-containing protein [Halteromyces radiatus]|uniref:GPR1/FUN34/yaaH family-domain-containing protein n=1 Tax=Halteromyces radiatus TaxID=101107 RepID=UPI00221EF807|nr:GPR1/FUN34/yaaH family-domain-containing protein [Halteromyces radiatus]KAI8096460.1 GPR1/FUN34/yaaH family-domain-containing protein [Halteromyces radiatus]
MNIVQKPEIQHHESIDMRTPSIHEEIKPVGDIRPLFKPGNPAAIGFASFATGSLVIGLYCIGLLTNLPQVTVGVALGFTGICQFTSGLLELLIGNTYAATTMMTYSGFFFSFGIMFSPASGFLEIAMKEGEDALQTCVGLYMLGYTFVSFIFFLGTFRQPWLIRATLLQVFLAFLTSCLGNFLHNNGLVAASGWISISLALTAYYVMATLIYDDTTTFIKLPAF